MLIESGIMLLDEVDEKIFNVPDGERIAVYNDQIYWQNTLVARGKVVTASDIHAKMQTARENGRSKLKSFLDNTLRYATSEKALLLDEPEVPKLNVKISGQPVLVAVRGRNYRDDIKAIKAYVREQEPVIIAVDGAADAIFAAGWVPDILIGDMDSISDGALKKAEHHDCELIVHAYPDGTAPGLKRLEDLGLQGQAFSVSGTSEDAALLLADRAGADLIVAVGTHTDPVEFLEKGRPGMASTLLVRLRIGEKLVDAKGVSRLYRSNPSFGELCMFFIAGITPAALVLWLSPSFRILLRLLALHIRISVAGG